jgi:small-conductance mechanosensitive channel
MANQENKENPYSAIEEKVKKIMAGIAEEIEKLSPKDRAVLQRAIKFLMRNTRAGAERLAILHMLGRHEAVPGTVLYQLCSQRVEKRVRELQSIGMDIRRWSETRPDGYYHSVYGWSGFRLWQEHRLLTETEENQPSLKRVM